MVLDIWLQGLLGDGIELLDTIKREQPDVPVVMISGHGVHQTASPRSKRAPMISWRSRSRPTGCCMVVNGRWGLARLKREVQGLKLKAGDEGEYGKLAQHHPVARVNR